MSAPVMTEKIYTVKEVADLLRLSPRTVRKMIAEREITAFRVRDEWRVRASDLEEYMKRTENKPEENST